MRKSSFTFSVSNVRATVFSVPGHLTARSDVYSFGVVLLEMLCGRRVIDKNRPSGQHNLIEWARPFLLSKRKIFHIMDARIQGQYSVAGAVKAASIAVKCLSPEPKSRPLMNEVVRALEQLKESEETVVGIGTQQNVVRGLSAGPKYRRRSANDIYDGKSSASYARPSYVPVVQA